MVRRDVSEILQYSKIIEDWEKDKLPVTTYCRMNNIDYKKFTTLAYRILYKRVSQPKEYQKLMEAHSAFVQSGMSPTHFCKINGIKKTHLSDICTHIEYLKIIEEAKGGPQVKEEPMRFMPIMQSPSKAIEPEILEPKNDIEITISQGIKVSIAPNIDSSKIIKIIELLKDL